MTDLPEPRQETPAPRRSAWRNLSLIWAVPLGALAVVLWIAWQSYANRGTLIEITFQNASGVVAGETTLRYRDVVVGTVETVGFTEGLVDVTVGVRVDNQILPYLDEDARFWVVRPEVSARGISGLSTVLSGAYIAAAWDLQQGVAQTSFAGFERAPLAQPGLDGVRIILRTEDGTTVASGAPVLYRGVQVGQLEEPRLTNTGETILIEAFIEAPHDQLVSSATRFWDTSGFSVSLGANGISLDVDSIATLVSGGVSFDRVYDNGEAVVPGQVFQLYENEAEARRRPFLALGETSVDFLVRFREDAAGLSSGSDVIYRGLQVGRVSALRTELRPDSAGLDLALSAVVQLDPQLMGLPPAMSRERVVDLMQGLVSDGLRAQPVSQGLLGGRRAIALVEVPDADPAALVLPEEGLPEIPSIPPDPSDLAASARGLLDRVAELPLDEVVARVISVLESIDAVVNDDRIRQVPDEVLGLLEDTRTLVQSDDLQALPGELRASIDAFSEIVVDLDVSRAVDSLNAALDAAAIAAQDVSDAVAGIPDLVTEIEAVARTAAGLPLDELTTRVSDILDNANALVASEEAQALPAMLSATLAELEAALSDLREGGTIGNLNRALASASDAAATVATAVEGLPELMTELETVARTAADLPLEEVVDRLNTILDSANALIASQGAQNLPEALTGALEQIDAALSELRAGGTVDNLNTTLASARDAAGSVARAADDLPELTARLNTLIAQTETLARSYDDSSDFNAQTLRMLREVSDAARALTQLAREIERNPNSLLFGR